MRRSRSPVRLGMLVAAMLVVAMSAPPAAAHQGPAAGGSGAHPSPTPTVGGGRVPAGGESRPVGGPTPTMSGGSVPAGPASLGRLLHADLARLTGGSAERGAALLARHGVVARATPQGTQVAMSLQITPGSAADVRAGLEGLGATVANELGPVIEAYVPASRIGRLPDLAGVVMAQPILRPLEAAAVNPGVTLQGGAAWQTAGLTGKGVKVGIIDGGFQGVSALLGNGLPAAIHARCYVAVGSYTSNVTDCENGVTHGTAVAETLAAMAPGASLYIADPTSWADEMQTVRWMTSNGVRIINASWVSPALFEGPGNGTSPFPESSYAVVDAATAAGALWVNAAGNSGDDGWQGSWSDANGNGWLDFTAPSESDQITLGDGQEVAVAIRWSEPWGSASADYVLDVFEKGASSPLASSTDLPIPSQYPYGIVDFTAPHAGTYDIRVWHVSGTPTPDLQILGWSDEPIGMKITTPGDTLATPADSADPGMLTVGAVSPPGGTAIEPYSSGGPTLDGRVKPDLVAVDCVDTTAIPEFCGTSESTPFVAGAAALVLQAHTAFTPAELAAYLKTHATKLGSPVPNNTFGYGRLNLGPVPGTAVAVRFGSQPLGATAGAPFAIQPTVQLVDGAGNPASATPSGSTSVTLALRSNPSGGTLQCSGGLTAQLNRGVATFTGCSIDTPGTGYTLTAAVVGLPQATSAPVTISRAGASLPTVTLATSASVIVWATSVTIRANLSAPAGGPAVANRAIQLQATRDGVTWFPIATLSSDTSGNVSMVYRPPTNLYYRAVFTGSSDLIAAASQRVRVVVRQIALLRPTSLGRIRQVAAGAQIAFTTTVRPDRAELPPAKVTYHVERWSGTAWVLVYERVVPVGSDGIARLSWTFTTPGYYYVRSVAVPTPYNANSVWSPVERYIVR